MISRTLSHSIIVLLLVICLSPVPSAGRFTLASSERADTVLKLTALRAEYKENPLAIDAREPRLSWQIQANGRGVMQSAYHVRVARSERDLHDGRNLVWDSGRIASDESAHCPYKGPSLQSGQRYYWQVRVWDANGAASDWSNTAYWEMGLLHAADWQASWIEPDLSEDPKKSNAAPMLRREFQINGIVERARAYVTSHGLYEVHLNGQRVGDQLFTPGWTSYQKRLQYQTYDVTNLIKSGANDQIRDIVSLVNRKSTRLNSSHVASSYAVFCLKKKKRRQL